MKRENTVVLSLNVVVGKKRVCVVERCKIVLQERNMTALFFG